MNTYGLTKEEYINLLKECGMCTKKWTYAKWKQFNERRLQILHSKNSKKKKWRLFKKHAKRNII